MITSDFPALLQTFFTDRLLKQRQASPHTVRAYRNTFRLLLHFGAERLGRPTSQLKLSDLNAEFLCGFLEHLEVVRGNSARTRNVRLAALHSFFRYVTFAEPAHALHCQRVLAIPSKRFKRGTVEFLVEAEIEALLDAPNASTWLGHRDRALLLVAVQTGLRVSELSALCRKDVTLGTGAHLRCYGKGRKLRCTPLRRDSVRVLEAWLRQCSSAPNTPVFPSSRGGRLSEDAIKRRVVKHAVTASKQCPSLAARQITPHTLRHTTAMQLLQSGVDRSVIALWLGHESIETTQIYLHADMQLKQQALAHTTESGLRPERFEPADALLAFLDNL